MIVLTILLRIPFTALGMIITGVIGLIVYAIKSAGEKSNEARIKKNFFDSIEKHYEEKYSGEQSGHAYVDLGLPSGTMWATCNVGAARAYERGGYYQWGHITTEVNQIRNRPIGAIPTYNIAKLDLAHDSASANWGGEWRMPTKEEFEELIESCEWELATYGDAVGYMITGPNGNSIFLPRTGYVSDKELDFLDYSRYWASQQVGVGEDICSAYALTTSPYSDEKIKIEKKFKIDNFAIRPVFTSAEASQKPVPATIEAVAEANDSSDDTEVPVMASAVLPTGEEKADTYYEEPVRKGRFLRGLGLGLIIMSIPLYISGASKMERAESVRQTNELRAQVIQDSANTSKTLGTILLVGGIAAIVLGIVRKSSANKKKSDSVADKDGNRNTLPIIIVSVISACLLVILILTNRSALKVKDRLISELNTTISDQKNEIEELKSNVFGLESNIQGMSSNVKELNSTIYDLKEDNKNLENALAKFPPLIITDVLIGITNDNGNATVDYGKMIYSSETMYISPKIYYYGTRSEDIELKYKLFTPNGKLSYQSGVSPSGFTFKTEFCTYEGENTRVLRGWGNKDKGHWKEGDYRIEIWYKTMCLYTKSFRIY